VEFSPGNLRRVVERLKDELPVPRGAIGLCAKKYAGVKDMLHTPVTEKKSQGLGLVALREVDI
jgi:hypothetical protein